MKTRVVIMVVLAVLVVMSFVQGMQISNLEELIKEGGIGAIQNNGGSGTPSSSTPAANAPAMVGGC